MGFHYLLLFPLALLLVRKDWPYPAKAALWVSLVCFLLIFRVQPNLRYQWAVLIVSMLPIALALSRLERADPPLYRAVWASAAAALFANFCFFPSAGWHHKDFVRNTLNPREELL